ncbi:MAG TPA: dipeptide ABC transporter ATP-binding protein [Amaricoccus sp.]|uniref:dipeptide ABC transporter ATP-binding protein n=1 Tax=Amaricoccus sp. TaxID=1872485 RepID=UPI002B7DBBDE|nr:dipeptide ABC transporter ATP-binding protein [Amaricoccus sp.]HMQ93564.1 dipeptide ABC transporter ATP-binding protein [Amaricoccus sp.]HMR53183.1 dipeptide ABC transporter ATP-binding protein [Amaricoccus sp.]HMR61422.1 dipeptide ABC transporter ATP-binding protein [Amaricoccus sp.]HMU00079.1 dipeptide ABC transporter ATP-binding protein [Amaricoccus sp.]
MSGAGGAIVSARNLSRHYQVGGGAFSKERTVRALQDASFDLFPGKTLAVVGESGCGKSTLARVVTMIEEPSSGTLEIGGKAALANAVETRRTIQIVFQNPYGSLNPRHKIGAILEEPLKLNTDMSASERRRIGLETMERVGLRPEHYNRYPHMFSGGQRQRIAIARALTLKPKVLVLDEPVSALDLSIQAQVLNLLADLQSDLGLAYLFISHDLSVVRHIADDIMVMYLGRAVEAGDARTVFAAPAHPYTAALMSATPSADPDRKKTRIMLTGELPSPLNPPPGCAFNPRCAHADGTCRASRPPLEPHSGRDLACFHPLV